MRDTISVLVVDDSAFMRKMVTEMLRSDDAVDVVDQARNGAEAVKKAEIHKPDVITMDVEMPVMSGLEALRLIMEHHPSKVIMLSSVTKQGAEAAIKAMEYGAFDFISKPSGSISLDINKVEKQLLALVHEAAAIPVVKMTPSIGKKEEKLPLSRETKESQTGTIVAVGTSTGGPKALQKLLTKLPSSFPYPILIVQHMPKGFTKSLSERLDQLSAIHVKEAEDGEIARAGTAYIAPGGRHLTVRKTGTSAALRLTEDPPVRGHRPSVDVMFNSLAEQGCKRVIAMVMTGMGSDGTEGIKTLKHQGNTIVITETEKTSVVYGMPKAAWQTGLADSRADLEDLARVLLDYC
ncbi:protein-glutamate methylesterase/protein-glutamine glutaminase [Alkalicoccus chagannorensis]|uniref:protein-glutamate methylesterase/protein-glutamine glutaminase n=1 Tax=Alkalicoccus chagannorensis TaxID=427072 RepID=UPI0003F89C51|nr:chemotaxis response regulator protein-glutamate methylesterase [Alkalicoccus chagannorensis]